MLSERLSSEMNPHNNTFVSYSQSIKLVIEIMKDELARPLSLQDMAEIANFSPFHFNRIFRMTTGIPPTQYLYALRIQQAKRLLLTTQLRVTDICFEVGYNSLGTFTRRFTELVGVSPNKLRLLNEDPSLVLLEPQCNRYVHPRPEIHHKGCIRGQVIAPAAFTGYIFVGLFPTQIPQHQPVACTILASAGPYQVAPVPKGRYYIFSAAYSYSLEPIYIGVGQKSCMVTSELISICIDISLHLADTTDPPVLISTPYLIARYLANCQLHTTENI